MTSPRPTLADTVAALDAAIAAHPENHLMAQSTILRDAAAADDNSLITRTEKGVVVIHLHDITASALCLSEARSLWHWRARVALGGHPDTDPAKREAQLHWALHALRRPMDATPETLAQSCAIALAFAASPLIRNLAAKLHRHPISA